MSKKFNKKQLKKMNKSVSGGAYPKPGFLTVVTTHPDVKVGAKATNVILRQSATLASDKETTPKPKIR